MKHDIDSKSNACINLKIAIFNSLPSQKRMRVAILQFFFLE